MIDFAKIGEKLSLTGSNCHYCKSIMTVQESNACRSNIIIEGNSKTIKKKLCNKKFCYDCLQKSFPSFWEIRNNKDWQCPCCSSECRCSQCRKNLIKSFKSLKSSSVLKDENNESEEQSNEKGGSEEGKTRSYYQAKTDKLKSAKDGIMLFKPKVLSY